MKTLEIGKSYFYIEGNLYDILNVTSFARSKIPHSSLISPTHLVDWLPNLSLVLEKNNLPWRIYSSSVTQYHLYFYAWRFQLNSKTFFVFKIRLVAGLISYFIWLTDIPSARWNFWNSINFLNFISTFLMLPFLPDLYHFYLEQILFLKSWINKICYIRNMWMVSHSDLILPFFFYFLRMCHICSQFFHLWCSIFW